MYATPPRYAPPGYSPYEYKTTPISPAYSGKSYHMPTQSKTSSKHSRHHSYAPSSYHYAPSPEAYYTAPPAYSGGAYYNTVYTTPTKPQDHVSAKERMRRTARGSADLDGSKQRPTSSSGKQQYSSHKKTASRQSHVYEADLVDDQGTRRESPPPSYPDHKKSVPVTDQSGQVPRRSSSTSEKPSAKTRVRTASFSQQANVTPSKSKGSTSSSKPKQSTPTPTQRPRTSSSATKSPPRKVTQDDLEYHNIPSAYSHKNWDPDEDPILLLGSVFDANSLGKWIYDWTAFRHKPNSPMAEQAGDLWLLMIQVAGKIKRAREAMRRVKYRDHFDLIDEFLESGEIMWERLLKILKVCEDYMWAAARKEARRTGESTASAAMSTRSGCEFVDSIFGRDRQLEAIEELMQRMRLWIHRFKLNCEKLFKRLD